MADHDSRERFLAITEAALGAYSYMQAMFEELPLPIVVPDFEPDDDEEQPVKALLGLNRVRELVADQPISDRRKRAFEHMVLDWFSAYEMLVMTRLAGPAPWRLDCAEFALMRLMTWIEAIEENEPDDSQS